MAECDQQGRLHEAACRVYPHRSNLEPPPAPPPGESFRRNQQLDVLRGVAILMVLLCHTIYLRQPTWERAIWRAGWSGVDLFFVVSGFLISGLLFAEYRKTGGIRFRRFAIRRALKIYPAFYVLVLLTVAVRAWGRPISFHDEVWRRLLHDVVFVQSYALGTWGHFWSLSVEEHFYILLPVTLFFLMRAGQRASAAADPFRSIPGIFAAAAVALLVARLLTARYVPYSYQTHLMATHLRLDSLLFGVVLSYWHHFHRERYSRAAQRYQGLILCAAAALLTPAFLVSQYDPWMYTYGFTSLYLGYGCLLVGFLHVPVDGFKRPLQLVLRATAYIGTFSYSIYLWHLPWLRVVQHLRLGSSDFVRLSVYYGGAILLGMLTGKLVEFPALRLREHLFPSSTSGQSIEMGVRRVLHSAPATYRY